MITVIVPIRLLPYLIKQDLEFKVFEQDISDEYIKIEFKNCPMSVDKFGCANYDYGYDDAKFIFAHKSK
jgi:hypothetical protein